MNNEGSSGKNGTTVKVRESSKDIAKMIRDDIRTKKAIGAGIRKKKGKRGYIKGGIRFPSDYHKEDKKAGDVNNFNISDVVGFLKSSPLLRDLVLERLEQEHRSYISAVEETYDAIVEIIVVALDVWSEEILEDQANFREELEGEIDQLRSSVNILIRTINGLRSALNLPVVETIEIPVKDNTFEFKQKQQENQEEQQEQENQEEQQEDTQESKSRSGFIEYNPTLEELSNSEENGDNEDPDKLVFSISDIQSRIDNKTNITPLERKIYYFTKFREGLEEGVISNPPKLTEVINKTHPAFSHYTSGPKRFWNGIYGFVEDYNNYRNNQGEWEKQRIEVIK